MTKTRQKKSLAILMKMILAFGFVLTQSSLVEAAQSFTVEGRILNPDGSVLAYAATQFQVSVYNQAYNVVTPATNCLLYQEMQTLDLSVTQGAFSLTIGNGTRVGAGVDGGYSLSQVFSNSVPLNAMPAGHCPAGVYAPGTAETRVLVLSYYNGSVWDTVPVVGLSWVPQALYAEDTGSLGGILASNYVTNAGIPTCGVNSALTWNGSAFSCLSSGAGSVTSVSSSNADIGVASGTSASVITLNSGTSANQIVKLNGSAQLPAVDGSLLTNLNASNFTSGTVAVNRGGTGLSGYVTGDLVVATGATALASLPDVTSGKALVSQGVGVAPAYSNAIGGVTLSGGNVTTAGNISNSSGIMTVSAATNLTVSSGIGSLTTIGNAIGASASVVQAGAAGGITLSPNGSNVTVSGWTAGFVKSNGSGVLGPAALAAGDITGALTYTPVNKAGDTMSASLTSPSFIPNSATEPTNGVYLPATNTVGIAANSIAAAQFTSTGMNSTVIGATTPAAGTFTMMNGTSETLTTQLTSPTIYGSTAASGTLTLAGTSNGTPGNIILNSTAGNVGIGTTTPVSTLDVAGTIRMAKNTSAPATCDATHDSMLATNANYTMCICRNGIGWVLTSDGLTSCTWGVVSSNGISDFGSGSGWQVNSNGNGSPGIIGGNLVLTNNVGTMASSAFFTTKQNWVTGFNVSFIYTAVGSADGMAFVIQNSSITALGASGGGLGYSGINTTSMAIEFNIWGSSGSAMGTNGSTGGYTSTSPVVLNSGHPISVSIGYLVTGNLTYTLTDQTTSQTITYNRIINLATVLGANGGYVGFSGGDGGATSTQTISNFVFTLL